ncbi:MAG: ATP-binding protein [Pseudomonadota bacterium]
MRPFPEKWRPSLSMIVVAMLLFVLCLPLGGIWLFRFYDSHLVRETESELIAQGAFVKAIVVRGLEDVDFDPDALPFSLPQSGDETFQLTLPKLDLSSASILPRRADAEFTDQRPSSMFLELGTEVQKIIEIAQETTLAGFRIVDYEGIVIAGRSETGLSLAHIPEIQSALKGAYTSVVRTRVSSSPTPPIYSISRGTGIRVFVAMPIDYQGKIAGVVYLSRTPSHFLRELYGQRWKLGAAVIFMLSITLIIAFIFVRTIKGPIDALNARTKRIANGDRTALEPLNHHGTREIASLSRGLLSMSEKLQDRTDYIRTFANHVSHELKSPLTSIKGAAELMSEPGHEMPAEAREKFLKNIIADTDRLSQLLDRLRDLAAADSLTIGGDCKLGDVFAKIRSEHSGIEIFVHDEELHIPLATETAFIVFSNLVENSRQHGCTTIHVETIQLDKEIILLIQDDGEGISSANSEKIFELFFTTRRDDGGTGMGLGIIQSMLRSQGGSIRLKPCEKGALFEMTLPSMKTYQ